NGIWTEAFSMKGDIDYTRLFEFLKQRRIEPHYVLEQAVEEKSPRKMTVIEAHDRSRAHLAEAL
ncbi:MAG: sugar phosphate isomerase/epimerase, partial [Verrucomicrobiota bacterium]